jgi:hypothetical protein
VNITLGMKLTIIVSLQFHSKSHWARTLVATEVSAMMTAQETVFILWCRLTGNDATEVGEDEREAFLTRPQVEELAATPYAVLLDAGITAARRGSLPLERWLSAVRTVRPIGV